MAGKQQHFPTAEQRAMVEAMAGYGIPHEDIATVVGIAPKTLREHYREQLDRGHVKANAQVAGNLFKIATGTGREAVTAAIFWLKCRAGWSEYAPAPKVAGAEPEPGKKALADMEAQNAEQGTGWAGVIRH